MQSNGIRRQISADLALLLVTLIWGSTFVMVKDAVDSYPVFPFLALRFALAAVGLLLIGGTRLRRLDWRGLGAGALLGVFLFAGYAFQTVGLQFTSASKAGFITGLSVVIVPLLATMLLRQRPGIGAVLGVAVATLGLAFLTLDGSLGINRGDLIVLGCALAFALHVVAVSAFAPQRDPLALTIVQVATVAVLSAGASFMDGAAWPSPTPATWFAAGFTGILATAVAFTLQTVMQRHTTATHTALIFAAEPVFAAVFGMLLAGDSLSQRGIAGGVLIVAGTVLSEIRWSERTARTISRWLHPAYVALPLLVVLAFRGAASWPQGLVWLIAIAVLSVLFPLGLLRRELRLGRISDWHITDRRERLLPVPVMTTLGAALAPLTLLVALDGPSLLIVAFASAALLVIAGLLITIVWKISQHVCGIAAATTLLTAIAGVAATPALLLIPAVAWARVKVGAHTPAQALAGGLMGIAITLLTLFLGGLL